MTVSTSDTPQASDVDQKGAGEGVGSRFVFDVDDVTYDHDGPRITGGEIMAVAGVSPNEGLIQVLPDGSRKSVAPDEMVHLVPRPQFKRRPRFKRG